MVWLFHRDRALVADRVCRSLLRHLYLFFFLLLSCCFNRLSPLITVVRGVETGEQKNREEKMPALWF
jgi:hypothetical protein